MTMDFLLSKAAAVVFDLGYRGPPVPANNGTAVPSMAARLDQFVHSPLRRAVADVFFDRFLPPLDGPRPELRFADHPSPLHQALRLSVGERHYVYSLLGIAATFSYMSLILGHYAMHVGLDKFLEQYRSYQERTEENPNGALHPVDPSFIDSARRHKMNWIRLMAWAYAMNVEFKGGDKKPDGSMIYGAAFHSAIFHNFFQTYADPNAMEVAEVWNFSWNGLAQMFGFSFVADLVGLLYVDRKEPKNPRLKTRLMSGMGQHDAHPVIFLERGRSRTLFDDFGDREEAGIFSCNPLPENPAKFLVSGGVVLSALDLANALGRPVSIALLAIKGGERVCSKVDGGRRFPFFGDVRAFQTIGYEIVDVLEVAPGMRRGLTEMGEQIERIMRRALETDALIEKYMAQWGRRQGHQDTLDIFRRRRAEDPKLLLSIIANRILAIHPTRHPERFDFVDRLIRLIHAEGSLDIKMSKALLDEVTKRAEEYEYERDDSEALQRLRGMRASM